jgi:hypothetical protein
VGEVLEIKGADKPAYADLDLVGLAVVNGPQFDPEKVQALPEPGEVFLIAREAIQRLDNDDVESPVPRRIHHAHEAVAAKNRGTRARPVIVGADHVEAVFRRVGAAQGKLVFDGAFLLELEACVNGGSHHCPSGSGRGKAALAARR